ncbi:MAG: metallophosphoesterase family protein [Syntrophomonadaceae bacterium]|nr:metallophosphoesterase family protein [Syntrophomonadaceae bacterium]
MSKKIIGVISDTHGLLRPEIISLLCQCDAIIHAGDIGSMEVIDELKTTAPFHAVRGNVDKAVWADSIPLTEVVEIENTFIYILHDLGKLDLIPEAAGFQIVISGHSHIPKIENKNGVMYLNPGSAGTKRFKLPVTAAKLIIDGKTIEAEILEF